MLTKAQQSLRQNRKGGFTLVELIVVLVILAILLAILVPSLIGWIKKAQEKQVLVDARTAYLAVQTIASEKSADGVSTFGTTELQNTYQAEFYDLSGLNATTVTSLTITDSKVTDMAYNNGIHTATLSGGTWTVTKNP